MINNRLITKGMGVSHNGVGNAAMITSGLGGDFFETIQEVVQGVVRTVVKGGSSAKHRLEQIIVFLRLIRVNNVDVRCPVMSSTTSTEASSSVNVTASDRIVVEQKESIVVNVDRIKKK